MEIEIQEVQTKCFINKNSRNLNNLLLGNKKKRKLYSNMSNSYFVFFYTFICKYIFFN